MVIDKSKTRLAQDAENFLIECALRSAIHYLRMARSPVDLIDADTLEQLLAAHIKAHGTYMKPPDLSDVLPQEENGL
jgi:hypothetical protein